MYGEIIWAGILIETVNQSFGLHTADVRFTGALNGPVYPTTVSISDGTNTFTDAAGDGVLTGAPAGTGFVDYISGEFYLDDAAFGDAIEILATYDYNNTRNPLPNAAAPMMASIRNEGAAGEFVVWTREFTGNWSIFATKTLAAWENVSIGMIPAAMIYVVATAKARMHGYNAIQT